jgi:ABC-type dipeptide/oligopeptide/nickel transport system permease component
VLRMIVGRVLGGLASIVGASILSFVLLRLLPADPARLILGSLASKESVATLRDDLGLNDGIATQYWTYVSRFLSGDWGYSYTAGRSVREQLGDRLPASLELGLLGLVIALVAAVLLALLATARRRPALDRLTRGIALIGLGTPPFWLGLMAIVVCVSWLGILPGPDGRLSAGTDPPPQVTGFYTVDALLHGDVATFWDAFQHLLLPALVLALGSFAFLVRLLRANLLEVSNEPFLLVARAQGRSRWSTSTRHALPNAILPTLTASGLLLAYLLSGSVLVEKVFNWPGVGALVVDSVTSQDYSVVQTFVLLSACAYVLINIVVDVVSGLIDPRIRKPAKA